jgi:hypothetical protein
MGERDDSGASGLNWAAVVALYAALLLGMGALLYGGDYRNAAWLGLIGTGGALTAYGRVLEARGAAGTAQWWKRGAAVLYAVFFVWAGSVLVRFWMGG